MPVTTYIWDELSDNILMETDENDAATAVYTNEPGQFGELMSQRRGGETNTYHFDGQKSTRELTDENENVTDAYTYSAFGGTISTAGTTVNLFRYVGRFGYYTDLESADIYVRRRNYDPATARWRSLDQVFLGATGAYAYANNDPIRNVDPSGLEPACSASDAIFFVHGGPPEPPEARRQEGTACALIEVPAGNCPSSYTVSIRYSTYNSCADPPGCDATAEREMKNVKWDYGLSVKPALCTKNDITGPNPKIGYKKCTELNWSLTCRIPCDELTNACVGSSGTLRLLAEIPQGKLAETIIIEWKVSFVQECCQTLPCEAEVKVLQSQTRDGPGRRPLVECKGAKIDTPNDPPCPEPSDC